MQYFTIFGLVSFCLLFAVFEIYIVKKIFALEGYQNIKIRFELSGVRITADKVGGPNTSNS